MPSNELAAFWPCDKCRQRSLEAWHNAASDLILTFCGHHGREYEVGLHTAGFRLILAAKVVPA